MASAACCASCDHIVMPIDGTWGAEVVNVFFFAWKVEELIELFDLSMDDSQ